MRSRKKLDTLRVLMSGYSLVGSDAFFCPLSDPVLDDAVADAVLHTRIVGPRRIFTKTPQSKPDVSRPKRMPFHTFIPE